MLGHSTYLVLELAWGLPVLALQWAVGRKYLWESRRTLLITLVVVTTYLSCADGVAISNGVWMLHKSRILGLLIGDVPTEEIIFFFLTNAMVAQSVVLIHTRITRRQFQADRT